jgi:hypothetical protein
MSKYMFALCAVLSPISIAYAGAVIDLVPTEPGPYLPEQHLDVQVFLTQEPGGEDVYLRLLQLDFRDTDPGITLDDTFRFDYSAQGVCVQNPALCGAQHLEFPELSRAPLVATVYLGYVHDPELQIGLPAEGTINVGSFGMTLPTQPGQYVLDVLNADETFYLGRTAQIRFGFEQPGDPYTIWRPIDDWAIAGGVFRPTTIAGAGLQFEYDRIPGVITPEPTALAFLTLGAIGLLRRHSRPGRR